MKIDLKLYDEKEKKKDSLIKLSNPFVWIGLVVLVLMLLIGVKISLNKNNKKDVRIFKDRIDQDYITIKDVQYDHTSTRVDDNYILSLVPKKKTQTLAQTLSTKPSIKGKSISYDNKKWLVKTDFYDKKKKTRTIKIKNGATIKKIVYHEKTKDFSIDNKKMDTDTKLAVRVIYKNTSPAKHDYDAVGHSAYEVSQTENQAEYEEEEEAESKKSTRVYNLPSIISSKKSNSKKPIVKTTQKIKARLIYSANSLKSQKIYATQTVDNNVALKGAIFIGSVSGYTMDRLDIDFTKLKLKNGKEYSISAHAVGIDNTPGIKGNRKNNIGTNAAKSLASTAIDFSSGHMLGSALDAALDPTLEQNNKTVVSVEKGVEFYVFFDEDFKI